MCLLNCTPDEIKPETFRVPEIFIAFGELKGGIDPAGADEHWKTAQTALARIRSAFNAKNLSPNLFFVGAVIVDSMANDIRGITPLPKIRLLTSLVLDDNTIRRT